MKKRLYSALGALALLGLLSGFTLTGNIRIATLIFLAGIGVKTYIAYLAHR